jgi:hypothetical protein
VVPYRAEKDANNKKLESIDSGYLR